MKARTLSAAKSLALSLAIGIPLVLLLFGVTGGSSESPFFVLLWPGAFLAERAGYHTHDVEGLLLYIVGNIAFYVVSIWLVVWLARARQKTRDLEDAASRPTNTTSTR